MSPLKKGVLFGPIRNWGNGESKILLEFDGEGGVKKRRQYVLEDVASWHKVSAFGEEGAGALRNAYRRAQILKKDGDDNDLWDHKVTQAEKEGREDEEVCKVVDKESARRAIEILDSGIVIQDLVSDKEAKKVDFIYFTKESKEGTLERIVVRVKDYNREASLGQEFT